MRYALDGAIESDDDEFDGQLNEVLNLNIAVLKNNRKGVLDSLLHWWRRQRGAVSRREIERQRDKYAKGSGDLAPYCQVAVWWLTRKLEKRGA